MSPSPARTGRRRRARSPAPRRRGSPVGTSGSGALRSQWLSVSRPNQLRLQRVVAVRQARIGGATAATSASTTSGSTRLARWRAAATSLKPRQRSEISLSLASVLVMCVKRRMFVLKVAASASAAALRFAASAVLQKVQRRLDGELLAVDREAQARHRLVEQAVPGAAAGHRLLVEELLDAILELVGLVLAHVLDPRPVVAERRIGHRRFEHRVVDAVELEREEQEMRTCRGDLLLHVAVELRAPGRWCRRHGPGRQRRRCGRAAPPAPRRRPPPRRGACQRREPSPSRRACP